MIPAENKTTNKKPIMILSLTLAFPARLLPKCEPMKPPIVTAAIQKKMDISNFPAFERLMTIGF